MVRANPNDDRRLKSGATDDTAQRDIDYSNIYVGIVKDNRVDLSGTLKVWLQGSPVKQEDPDTWITCRYAPPFAGATPQRDLIEEDNTFEGTQKSYGMWFVPPDLETMVLVAFIEADRSRAVWFSCLYNTSQTAMVPGIPGGNSYQSEDGVSILPISERNTTLDLHKNLGTYPQYTPLVKGLKNQGLLKDSVRGVSSSGTKRESPSRVMGILTPRGHQIVFDDGEPLNTDSNGKKVDNKNPVAQSVDSGEALGTRKSEYIRFRTRSGAQVLISETDGMVYLISRDGNTWIEVNNEGYVDIYGALDISIRSEANINLRADKDVNIEAGNNINVKATAILQQATADFNISGSNVNASAGSSTNIKSGSNSYITSGASTHIKSTDQYMSGSNSWSHFSGGGQADASAAGSAATPTSQTRADKNWIKTGVWEDTTLNTIVARLPTHEPWQEHHTELPGNRNEIEEPTE